MEELAFYQLKWVDNDGTINEERIPEEAKAIKRRRELKDKGFNVDSQHYRLCRTVSEVVKIRKF